MATKSKIESQADTTQATEDALASRVQQVVTQGVDVQAAVRQMTLDAMSHHAMSLEAIHRIMRAVLQGTREGVQEELDKTKSQTQAAQARMKDAVAGLDGALAQFAAATQLAVEEAAGKAQNFSNQDLASTRADLQSLEALFLETIRTSAEATRGMAADMWADMLTHTQRSGTLMSEQVKATLETLTQQMTAIGKTQVEASMHLAQTTADVMRKVTTGVITGLAERVKSAMQPK